MQQETTRHGLLTLTCGSAGNVIRLIPALVVTEEEITLGAQRFENALTRRQAAAYLRPDP
ncbi:4-aminobutyrate transaminase [Mycolicibacterium vaccae ATCC 25954]|uniref:4-aminobutyrate transaminase n=1 Tax=Mycolicibacterium vaccae ATCC 25954 TaxID=1194972 RepID=K0UHI1_MYCVA|nr:4-aminobutyrate transaminase [Mycolicibacterium vaccae 95051]EJZ06722.1 4-aminobutyrate transaminase [Mycolicibacterium vaccae ATCC 25954]